MSKKCLKCGISITDGSSDYCYQCGKDMQQKKQSVPKGIDEEAIGISGIDKLPKSGFTNYSGDWFIY